MMKNKYLRKDYKRLYEIYYGIKKRCYNKNCARYKDYGGRGIVMCEEWLNGIDYFIDWALSNGYEDGLTIDRINNDGNYSPDNCRWATYMEQGNNTRRNVYVEYNGEVKSLTTWCRELNLNYDMVHGRIRDSGWSVERAFTEKSLLDNSLASKCREHNIKEKIVIDRINKLGWDLETALNTPVIRNGIMHKNVIIECPVCKKEFRKKNGKNLYCSTICRDKAKLERRKLRNL